jgi:GT2 family glycosyltransferase
VARKLPLVVPNSANASLATRLLGVIWRVRQGCLYFVSAVNAMHLASESSESIHGMVSETIDHWLTISIATKDRPGVVENTLRRLHAFGLGECEVLVCDDGSTPPLALPALRLFPRGHLIRHSGASGQAVARNHLVEAATKPYVLQLDDDSYPVCGNFEELLLAAREQDDWLAMALPLEEPARGRRAGARPVAGMPLRGFVGCAALLNRQVFLATGGYANWIGGMVEEDELSIRAFKQGFWIRGMGSVTIRHDATSVQRNLERIQYLCFRNWTSTWLRHAPFPEVLMRMIRLAGASLLIMLRSCRTTAIRGFFSGLVDRRSYAHRYPMTRSDYRAFVRLPHALEILSTDA